MTAAPPAPPSGWRLWLAGARPKTLPAALVPVIVGAALAAALGGHDLVRRWATYAPLTSAPPTSDPAWLRFLRSLGHELGSLDWLRLLLTAVVALGLQVGVNYANDYSDGVRGTDEQRVGPLRLVGSGLVPAKRVRAAALLSFGVAAVAGVVLAAETSWWLVVVGLLAVAAAWGYTGGPKPYGYLGLGELFVFVFFGLVATVGTVYLQLEHLAWQSWVVAVPVGLLAVALLEGNNLRDVSGDAESGKRTLAVRLGRRRGAWLYVGAIGGAAAGIVATALAMVHTIDADLAVRAGLAPVSGLWPLLGLFGLVGLRSGLGLIRSDAEGRALLPVLGATGKAQLRTGLLLALGLLLSYAPL